MNGYPTIYTDGSSYDLSTNEAAYLVQCGLVVPHPGAGEDGITDEDLKIAPGVEWKDITDALASFHIGLPSSAIHSRHA